MSTKSKHIKLIALLALPVFAAFGAFGFSIDRVGILPTDPITEGDDVLLRIDITTSTAAASLYSPTQVLRHGQFFQVDVFPTAGLLTILDHISETVSLGRLSQGQYDYEVDLHPAFDVPGGVRSVSGSFRVVPDSPLPQFAVVILFALLAIARQSRLPSL